MDKKVKLTVIILCLVPLIMVLGNSMLIPVLPSIQKVFQLDVVKVGLLITVFSVPAGLVIPFAGVISDRIGRKKVMVPALLIYGAGGLLAGLFAIIFKAKAFPWIIGARIIQGIGAGGTYQLSMALAGDLIQSSERSKVLGYLEAANGMGKVVSPLAGAALALISWYIPFFVYGLLAMPVAFLVLFLVKEDLQKVQLNVKPIPQYLTNLKHILREKWLPLLINFLSGLVVMFALFGVLSFYADLLEKQFKMNVFIRGLVLAVPVLVMTITAFILGNVMQKRLTSILKWGVVAGLMLVAAGLFAFCPCKNMPLFTISASLLGLGAGMVLPSLNTLITSAAPKTERGIITCLYGTVRFFGVAMGPPLFGYAEKLTKPPVFFSTAGVCVALGLLFLFLVKPDQIIPKDIQGA